MDSKVVQITNICPTINVEQVRTFLTFIGRLEHLRLYPERPNFLAGAPSTKVCYAKFQKLDDAAVALHLTNTVFIDRALIVVPVENGIIPDETEALKHAHQDNGPSPFALANPVDNGGTGSIDGKYFLNFVLISHLFQ
jgi:splicing factor, arginine/serine-rich 12